MRIRHSLWYNSSVDFSIKSTFPFGFDLTHHVDHIMLSERQISNRELTKTSSPYDSMAAILQLYQYFTLIDAQLLSIRIDLEWKCISSYYLQVHIFFLFYLQNLVGKSLYFVRHTHKLEPVRRTNKRCNILSRPTSYLIKINDDEKTSQRSRTQDWYLYLESKNNVYAWNDHL